MPVAANGYPGNKLRSRKTISINDSYKPISLKGTSTRATRLNANS